MKKLLIPALSLTVFSMLVIVSCKFKNNDNITPTYRNQATGTGANPNINVVTVTGTQTVTNMATQNSAIQAGRAGWVYESCLTNPNMLIGHNGNITIQIIFNGGVTSGTFNLTPNTPNTNQAQMLIFNAPGQPEGITWYSTSGTVVVTPAGSGYSATFSNIPCLQYNFLFPVVTVSGNLIC